MRLRSSQFVFLILLVCAAQVPGEHALGWMAVSASGSATHHSQTTHVSSVAAACNPGAGPFVYSPATFITLGSALHSAYRTPWDMRRPAQHAADVASHTGLLRV